MRRVTCPDHGVIVEGVPCGDGKCAQTIEHRQFLVNGTRRLSGAEVAECFGTTFGKVCTNALNILDRFHVKGHLTDVVNETRKSAEQD